MKKENYNLLEEKDLVTYLITKNTSLVNIFNLNLIFQLNFCNNLYQNIYKTSTYLIDKHNLNTLKEINEPMIPEEPKLLTQISLINKEISIKYSNLINNYNEVIVQPFNQFTTNYEKFFSEYNIEFGNI